MAPWTRIANAGFVGDVGAFHAQLADLGERLERIGLPRIALGDADPDPAVQQGFADIAADESAAAEHRHQLFVALDHGVAR